MVVKLQIPRTGQVLVKVAPSPNNQILPLAFCWMPTNPNNLAILGSEYSWLSFPKRLNLVTDTKFRSALSKRSNRLRAKKGWQNERS
jgi:hypothetical protein